jgi:hypothetical protein
MKPSQEHHKDKLLRIVYEIDGSPCLSIPSRTEHAIFTAFGSPVKYWYEIKSDKSEESQDIYINRKKPTNRLNFYDGPLFPKINSLSTY